MKRRRSGWTSGDASCSRFSSEEHCRRKSDGERERKGEGGGEGEVEGEGHSTGGGGGIGGGRDTGTGVPIAGLIEASGGGGDVSGCTDCIDGVGDADADGHSTAEEEDSADSSAG